jgi:hypothetical protein
MTHLNPVPCPQGAHPVPHYRLCYGCNHHYPNGEVYSGGAALPAWCAHCRLSVSALHDKLSGNITW